MQGLSSLGTPPPHTHTHYPTLPSRDMAGAISRPRISAHKIMSLAAWAHEETESTGKILLGGGRSRDSPFTQITVKCALKHGKDGKCCVMCFLPQLESN